jgi:hypothetical protein
MSRAQSAIVLIGVAACSGSGHAGGHGDDAGAPSDARERPSDAGALDTSGDAADAAPPRRLTFDGPDHGADACNAIAAGPGDSIIVAGQVQRFAQGDDAWAQAFDAAGGVAWTYELSTPSEGHDRATGVVALPDGGALVAGTWFSGSNTRFNSFVLQLTPAGSEAWSRLEEIVGDDAYNAIARDAAGRIFVAGSRADAAGQPQAWLRALSATGGSELWAVTRPGAGAAATAVAIAPGGDVLVGGNATGATTGADGWIARYSPAGMERWSLALASPGADRVTGVAASPDGSVAVVGELAGSSSIRVYGADGTPRWDVTAAGGPGWAGVAVDAAGNVVVAGCLGGDLVTRKYTAAGVAIWERRVPGARGNAVAIDGHGGVLVCGSTTAAGNTDGLILAFPP